LACKVDLRATSGDEIQIGPKTPPFAPFGATGLSRRPVELIAIVERALANGTLSAERQATQALARARKLQL
jgi:hypothetical protein